MKRLFVSSLLFALNMVAGAFGDLAAALRRTAEPIWSALIALASEPAAALHRLLAAGEIAPPPSLNRDAVRSFHTRRVDRPDVGGYSPGFAPAL